MYIDGYLTQSKLTALLEDSESVELLGTEVKVGTTRKRWDCLIRIGNTTYAVEFDGQGHYQNPATILSDNQKDVIAASEGYKVIRIPYWVQLTPETSKYYFGIDVGVTSDFPHGFIDAKALLPAAYCYWGLMRFLNQLEALPVKVSLQVKKSLRLKVDQLGKELVIPSLLYRLLD